MNNPNLYVVTGGPGSGKTTVLLELARRGYQIAPEVARQIIQEQVKQGGSALPWEDRERYTELMLQRSIESFVEHSPAKEMMFADRGIPDTLGYARLIGLRNHKAIREVCQEYRYAARVFLAPMWKEIYTIDSERKQTLREAEQTARVLSDVYQECGYEVVELPKTSVEERAEFILRKLDFWCSK
jgi:predicted ATPase